MAKSQVAIVKTQKDPGYEQIRAAKVANQLSYLPGITIVTGDPNIPEYVPKDSLVTVGRCVPDSKKSKRHVKGCPPNNLDIVQAIVGGRTKAERRWE